MNLDPLKAVANGSAASSSNASSPKPYLANGGCLDKSYSSLSNEFSIPPGGIPSLRLPTVVVLSPVHSPSCDYKFKIVVIFQQLKLPQLLLGEISFAIFIIPKNMCQHLES